MMGHYRFVDVDGVERVTRNYVIPEFRKGSSQDVIIPLARRLVGAGEKVIVFRQNKGLVRGTAQYLALNLGLPPAADVLMRLPALDQSVASGVLRTCVEHGVAFHNADLDREERECIEADFRNPDGGIKILVATTTLAMGVNTPAWSVIIEGLEHPGNEPYLVAEYKNMVGRAGRLGWSPKGKSFLVASGDASVLWGRYVVAEPEALTSRFAAQSLVEAVCRVLGTATGTKVPGLTQDDVSDFLQSTFARFQQRQRWSAPDIDTAIQRLVRADLVIARADRLYLTPLGEVAGQLGISVESVVRVAASTKGIPLSSVQLPVLIAAAQVTTELDDVYLPLHSKSVQERTRWQAVMDQQRLPGILSMGIRRATESVVTARCKRLAAALMWAQGKELNQIERSLLQHMRNDNVAGPIRSVADRTRDVLGVVAKVMEIQNPGSGADAAILAELVDVAGVQLELGIPRSVAWLGKKVNRQLNRGDYLSLVGRQWTSPETLGAIGRADLLAVLQSDLKADAVRDAVDQTLASKRSAESLAMPEPPENIPNTL